MKIGVRELMLLVLLAAVPVGAYYWVFRPANSHIAQQRVDIAAKKEKLASLQKAMVHIKDIDAEVAKLSEAVVFFEGKLPAEHEIHKVLKQVAKVAEKQSLETKLFESQKPRPFARYWEQPIKMEVSGNFESYYRFLLELENLPRITRIKELELKQTDKSGEIKAKFVISIFFDRKGSAV